MATWPMSERGQGAVRTTKNPPVGCERRRETKIAGRPKSWDCHDMLGVPHVGRDRLALGPNGAHAFRGPLEPPREHGVRTNEATMIDDRGRSTSKPRNWARFAAL